MDNDTADASTATVRPGNRLQILKKTASTSGSVASVDLAGTRNEMAYQMAKRQLNQWVSSPFCRA